MAHPTHSSRRATTPPHPAPGPPAFADDVLAEALTVAFASVDPDGAAHLLRLARHRDGVRLGLAALPHGAHPVDVLLGLCLPDAWDAIGVVAPGRATVIPPREDGATPVLVGLIVGRDGAMVHRVAPGPVPAPVAQPEGRLVDLCRRAVGVATPPPPVPVRDWWGSAWCDRILASVSDDPSTTTWAALLALAPIPPGRVDLITWAEVRAAVEAGVVRLGPPLVAADAAWFDDGSLARWLVSELPPLDVLLDATAARLAPDLQRRLLAAVSSGTADGGTGAADIPERRDCRS